MADRVAILRQGTFVTVTDVGQLRRRTRRRIDLLLAGEADAEVFAGVPGVVERRSNANLVQLVVEGSMDAVVKAAARLPIERITTSGGDLEEVFLEQYRQDDQ